MPDRLERAGFRDDSGGASVTPWSYEDQERALREGFNSVVEWAVFHLVQKFNALEQRVEAMEEAHARRGEPI